eukprot:scaffold116_cov334-Pavlova_lutheri.AAC.45
MEGRWKGREGWRWRTLLEREKDRPTQRWKGRRMQRQVEVVVPIANCCNFDRTSWWIGTLRIASRHGSKPNVRRAEAAARPSLSTRPRSTRSVPTTRWCARRRSLA